MEMLERASQLSNLESALSKVEGGQGCVALVYGEAGIGKTSLVEHFTNEHKKTWRILLGACDSLFTPRPLGPLLDIAAQTQGQLLELLESEANRSLVFSAFLNELRDQPTILVVEDIHWADEATFDLLKYLGRRIRQIQALILLTYRDDEVGRGHPLLLLLGDLTSSQTVQRVPVSLLSRAAVGELAKKKEMDGNELYHLTNGNAFFVTEVLAGEGGIPETVRDAVLARAARLSASAHRLLEAAAVIGLRSESRLLYQVAGEDAASIGECVSKGMLQPQGEYYAFRHELARQIILESVASPQKIELHRMTLAALEEFPETRNDLARLANHAEGTKDAEAVLEYAPAAARQASAARAHREAAALYELALQYPNSVSAVEHGQMLEAYANELYFGARMAERASVLQEAADFRHSIGDSLREGLNLSMLAESAYGVGQFPEAEQASQAAISMLEALPPSAELAEAYRSRCYIRMQQGDFLESVAAGEKAVALAERFGETEIMARAYNYMGCVTMPVDYERGRELLERSLAIARETDIPFARGGALNNLGWMSVKVYQLDDAERFLAEGIAYATSQYDDYHLQEMFVYLSSARLYRGAWSEARELAMRAMQFPPMDNEIRTYALTAAARLGVRSGEQDALPILSEALELAEQAAALPRLGLAWAVWAEAKWLSGDDAAIPGGLRSTYELAVNKRHIWPAGELAFWRWRAGEIFPPPDWIAKPFALQIAGDWQGAAQEWQIHGCPYEQGMALMDGDEAAQLAALVIFERLGARPIIEKLKQKMRSEGVRGIPRGPRPASRQNRYGLTPREMEVLACLVKGSSNPAIARELSLSARTVEHHIGAMLQKTGVQYRGELVALALKENLVVIK